MSFLRVAQCTLFSLFLASGRIYADDSLNLPLGVTPISQDIYHLHMTTLWVCVAIGIIVFGAMLHAIIYHRKSLGVKPAHFHEHRGIEVIWTLIPFLILVSLAVPATRVLTHMHDETQADLTIKVTGSQWKWHYDYLENNLSFYSNISTPYAQIHGSEPKGEFYLREVDHPLVVPIHKKIRFLITSTDVIHGWWVPELGVKHDAIPGFIYEAWARINRPGTYRGQCSKLCGLNHGFMPIVVIAMSENDFAKWIQQQKNGGQIPAQPTTVSTAIASKTSSSATTTAKPAAKLTKDALMKEGEQVFLGTCAACHKPDGTGSPPIFPALKGSKTATGPVAAHINTVLNGRPGTAMQAFRDQFNDEQLAAVITYERNAFGNNTGDVVQPADITAAKAKKTAKKNSPRRDDA